MVNTRISARDLSGAGTLHFNSVNLSPGGTFLKSEMLLELGERLTLEFEVPGHGTFKADAKVAWVNRFPKDGDSGGMGMQFLNLTAEELSSLNKWLSSIVP